MDIINANIRISGIVQGVGFRPFVHRQMSLLSLSGWIRNTSEGLEIETEGDDSRIDIFIHSIQNEAPVLAYIEHIEVNKSALPKGLKGISILPSLAMDRRDTLISPDVAVCPDCLREMHDPSDRRYRYPFINCTNCGPRFTILRDVPYDRAKTSMSAYPMCRDCETEYGDICNRRYHAQPDCCAACGPELYFLNQDGERMPQDPIYLSAKALQDGKIIAVKGLGGFHLACRANDVDAVNELRRRKHRDQKPFAIMCRDMAAVRSLCFASEDEEALLTGHVRPIVLLKKKNPKSLMHLSANRDLGIMLPYTPLHHLLMEAAACDLVMTSANISDLPIISSNSSALACLRGIADGFLMHDRHIQNRCDDSLMRIFECKPFPLRRSRGYVPLPLEISWADSQILACGAEQKASFCISRKSQVFPSAHIGDLKNAETLEHYEDQIRLFKRLFDINPQKIVCDLHPDYLSSDYAQRISRESGLPLVVVQHHHAHMAACMADNHLKGRCIGIIWDGTGLGSDGAIWGGEFLTGDYAGFMRSGTMRAIRLPGGDKAVREIRRIAVSLLLDAGIDPETILSGSDIEKTKLLLDAGLNCPQSSGMGRLFDGVCAMIGICSFAGYEGQGAVLLEAEADEDCAIVYPYDILADDNMFIFDHRSLIRAICADVLSGAASGRIAAGFMNTLVVAAREICMHIRSITKLSRVVLSGGVFQNMYLLERLKAGLEANGFDVYCHSRVPTNDEGISFGQLAVAEGGGGTYVPCGTAEDC